MNEGCAFTILGVLLITLIVCCLVFGYFNGYKQGQIDVMTGKVQYCLEKQDNSEFTWKYHSEGCK